MSKLEFLTSYIWPTDEVALASLGIRLSEIARRNSLPTQSWIEDGWGEAAGVMCRTESGFTFLVRELQHSVENFGGKGPDILVDAGDLGTHGVESLLTQVLTALNVSRSELTWMQDASFQHEASKRADLARAYHEKRKTA